MSSSVAPGEARSEERDPEVDIGQEGLARCEDVPPSHSAGCELRLEERTAGLWECAELLRATDGGDTLNFRSGRCQVLSCLIHGESQGVGHTAAPKIRSHLLAPSGTLELERFARQGGGAGGADDDDDAGGPWTRWPGLEEKIDVEREAVVFAAYQASILSASARLVVELTLDGAPLPQTRCISQPRLRGALDGGGGGGEGDLRHHALGFFVGSVAPGSHSFAVRFRLAEPPRRTWEADAADDTWQSQSLNVVVLPWASARSTSRSGVVALPSSGQWAELPGSSDDLALSAWTVVLATFHVAAEALAAPGAVACLFVDGLLQQETCAELQSGGEAPSAAAASGCFVGALGPGSHTFGVLLRRVGGLGGDEGGARGAEAVSQSLSIASLPGATWHLADPKSMAAAAGAPQGPLVMAQLRRRGDVLAITQGLDAGDKAPALLGLRLDGVELAETRGVRGGAASTSSMAAWSMFHGSLPAGRHSLEVEVLPLSPSSPPSAPPQRWRLAVVALGAAVPYTAAQGGMDVYSLLCSSRSAQAPGTDGAGKRLIGKAEDYWTTSVQMKDDLIKFFGGIAQRWTLLELGSYRGYTTQALSHVFRTVITVDASDTFLRNNKEHNTDRDNIVYANLHSRMDGLRSLRRNDVHVAIVDAEHDYESVRRDVLDVLLSFGQNLRYLVFDDYATDDGVRRVVEAYVASGDLELVQGIGLRPPWKYYGQVVHHFEGVICRVTGKRRRASNSSSASEVVALDLDRVAGRMYTWFAETLMSGDDVIQFARGGMAVTSRGPGSWKVDKQHSRAVWLVWPSEKPEALGGPPSSGLVTRETWYLQFDEEYDKFAAGSLGDAKHSAAGVAQDVMEAMFRRMFVSVTHEWCSTANQCGHG